MQHTTKYKFNLIETSDTFSPDALNANEEAVEKELARVETAHAADKTALEKADAAVRSEFAAVDAALKTAIGSGGKTCRIVYGTYKGTGKSVTVDFKPLVVFISYTLNGSSYDNIMFRGCNTAFYTSSPVFVATWGDRTVTWQNNSDYRTSSTTNYYVVIGESD